MGLFYSVASKAMLCFVVFLCLLPCIVSSQTISSQDAMAIVEKNKDALQLPGGSMLNVTVQRAYHDKTLNADLIYLQQTNNGIPVFQSIKTIAFKNGKLVSATGEYVSVQKLSAKSATPAIDDFAAIAAAAKHLGISMPQARLSAPKKVDEHSDRKKYESLGISKRAITIELLWIIEGKSLTLAKQVNISPVKTADDWLVNVDATTGSIINKLNLTQYCNFDHPGEAHTPASTHTVNKISRDKAPQFMEAGVNATYRVVPFPAESMDHPGGAHSLVTNPWLLAGAGNPATTLGWHNDGVTEYSITRGNNVWAKEDRAADNEATIGQSAESLSTPDLTFDYPYDGNQDLTTSNNQKAATTNLFYWNNIVHDIAYQYGFDEASGNFQNDNLGRGGMGNDFVLADVQDGSETNNANFNTPNDGTSGRMQMFLWTRNPLTISINSPANLAGNHSAIESAFSPNNHLSEKGPITGNVVLYDAANGNTAMLGCSAVSGSPFAGKIALIYRGTCTFTVKVKNAQNAGAIGVIVVQNTAAPLLAMAGEDPSITIPAVMISATAGNAIRTALVNNEVVNVTLNKPIETKRDSDFDNGIIVHEYGHGISHRLTGGSCLSSKEQMGEGWSDYYALMLTTDWRTASVSDGTKSRAIGTHAAGLSANGSGIRTYPYNTDKAINPWDYSLLPENGDYSQVHAVGEVWATVLWDMTWNLIAMDGINTNLYNADAVGGNSVAHETGNTGT